MFECKSYASQLFLNYLFSLHLLNQNVIKKKHQNSDDIIDKGYLTFSRRLVSDTCRNTALKDVK